MNPAPITDLVIATTNHGKLAEMKQFLSSLSVNIKSLEDFPDGEEAIEDGKTFSENARIKAQHYSRHTRQWVLADDSGLSIDALNGEPGVYSSRYAVVNGKKSTHQDLANIEKVLDKLQEVSQEHRQACFCCALCLCDAQGNIHIEVEGRMEGLIINDMRGNNGFGYDPIFYLPDIKKTAAELLPDEKLQRSHRGQALRQLVEKIDTNGLI